MKLILYNFLFIMLFYSFCYSQNYDNSALQNLYEHLNYETPTHKPLQEKWEITDPELIREILEKLYNNDALELEVVGHYHKVEPEEMKNLADKVQKNKISIKCVKRYFDDNLEKMEFVVIGEDTYLKPLEGWWKITEEKLSPSTYKKVKEKNYDLNDYTIPDYYQKLTPYVSLNLYHSEFVLGTLFSNDSTDTMVKFYSFYRLGYDNINLPSWYKGNILLGIKYKVEPIWAPDRLNYERFSISLGWDAPINFTIQKDFVPSFMKDIFRDRLLVGTSDNFFFGFSWSPYPNSSTDSGITFWQLKAEASLPIVDKKKSSLSLNSTNIGGFYSIRNQISASGMLCNIGNFFDIGTTVSTFGINKYSALTTTDKLEKLDSKQHLLFSAELGFNGELIPLYYTLSPQINFDITNGQKFAVIKSMVLFFRTFGIEFGYFRSLNGDNTEPWHYKDYIVISPIIMIN